MKINKMKALFKWSTPHILLMIVILLLTIIIPVTYSYVPQFVKYIFDYILLPNPDASNSLPQFLKDFFSSFEDLQSVLVVGITLVILPRVSTIAGCSPNFNVTYVSVQVSKVAFNS